MKHELDDRTVDAVAQGMTAPPALDGFRDRVLDRLDERRRPWFLGLAPAPALAGAALVALAASVAAVWIVLGPMTPEVQLASTPTVAEPVVADAALTEPLTPPALEDAFVPATAASTVAAAALPVEPEMSTSEQAWRERAIPALTRPDEVVVSTIQPVDVDIPLLEMKPLAPERLALQPLGSGPNR